MTNSYNILKTNPFENKFYYVFVIILFIINLMILNKKEQSNLNNILQLSHNKCIWIFIILLIYFCNLN